MEGEWKWQTWFTNLVYNPTEERKHPNIKTFEATPKQGEALKTVVYDSKIPPRGKAIVKKSKTDPTLPITTSEAKEIKKSPKEEAKAKKPKQPKLTETEQKVLDFCKTLDQPATSNERRIFKKLDKLGFGENRKESRKYAFYVKVKYREQPETGKNG
jgi:hypothetical protein